MPLYMNWLVVGATLAILELIVPGTYLIWFGAAALVISLVTWLVPDLSVMWQLIWLAFFSVVFAFIGWKVYGWTIFKAVVPEKYRDLNNPIAQLTGKTVEVVAIKGDKIQVSVGDTVWTAVSDDTFKVGEKAVISGSSNNVELKIKKLLDKKNKKE